MSQARANDGGTFVLHIVYDDDGEFDEPSNDNRDHDGHDGGNNREHDSGDDVVLATQHNSSVT